MSCANICTVCLSVYTPKEAVGWTGMSPDCFRGKCMHQIVGAFQTVHKPLRTSCSPLFPRATTVYFFLYSCLSPGIWQGLYFVTFSSSTAIIRSKKLVFYTNRRSSVLMQKYVNAPFVPQYFAGYWCTPFSIHLGPSGAMRRLWVSKAKSPFVQRCASSSQYRSGHPRLHHIYGTLPSPASKPSAERLIPAATAIDA